MKPKDNHITITADEIVLHLDSSKPIAIPRSKLRTRLRLLDWTYSLIGRPGITLPHLRAFIAAVFRHHGWTLPPEERRPPRHHFNVKDNGNTQASNPALELTRRGSGLASVQHA